MPDNDTPELIPRLYYSKNWEDPADYATHQHSEVQNRRDIQSLFTEIASYINNVMLPRAEQLLSESGGGSGEGGTGGVSGDYLPLDGGTMRGILRLYREPELDAEAATKHYADTLAGGVATDFNGRMTAIRQSADALELLAQRHGQDIATLQVRADEISSSVANVDGRVSTLEQTADGFETRVTTAEGDISSIRQAVDGISLSVSTVTDNGEVYSKITLRLGQQELYGYIKMDGNVDISGQLSADALYSGYGEIANLAVDTLNTSRRIARYLARDTSDDNFIRAQGQNVEWVTGECNGGTIQATNPDGEPLFWPVDVSRLSRGADGYPVTAQQERIFTTTTPTEYPVMVYTYGEAVKRSISFEAVNGIYSPVDRFGAGNQQGNNKAWILKTADGFDIRYLTPDNKEIGIRMTTDGKVTIDGLEYDADKIRAALGAAAGSTATGAGSGGASGGGNGGGLDLTQVNADGSTSGISVDEYGYMELAGLRKVSGLDFSEVDRPGFNRLTEALDGGLYNQYRIERDSSGRVAKITDVAGHETVITWGEA
ncbi:MAG: hypothetical protein IKR84_01715 [Oscillibacter sp.]|nr:hypothetical protein [Oscillibacter sp.]